MIDDKASDSEDAFGVYVNVVNMSELGGDGEKVHVRKGDLALCDTCCARSVAGEAWLTKFMMRLWKRESPCYAIAENQTFRFGTGPKKESKMAVLLPTCVESQGRVMFLRVSMVEDDVPLLLSHRALEMMGGVLDLPRRAFQIEEMDMEVPLHRTRSGHVGFRIWSPEHCVDEACLDYESLFLDNHEVKFVPYTRTRVSKLYPNITSKSHRPSNDFAGNIERDSHDSLSVQACSSLEFSGGSCGVASLTHGSIAGSQVEGRVRERHCSSHGRNSRPVAAALSGQIEGHLDGGEARKSSEISPRELEEIRPPISQGLVCRHLCAILPEGRRWPLGAVQKITTDHGVGDLPVRSSGGGQGGECWQTRGGCGAKTPPVFDFHAHKDQPSHQGALLGMSAVPDVQGNLAPDLCRPSNSPNPARDGRKERSHPKDECKEGNKEAFPRGGRERFMGSAFHGRSQ